MDGPLGDPGLIVPRAVLDRLMPMHARLDEGGRLVGAGPTLARLLGPGWEGRAFLDLVEVRRPGGVTSAAALIAAAGRRLTLHPAGRPDELLKGMALAHPGGLLLNLSCTGAVLAEVVRRHALTDADFAPTDLALDLLYVDEARSAVSIALKSMANRLQGAKVAAEEQALTDMLTGLRNRRAAEASLEALCRDGTPFGLMHMDLDYFKSVNDTLGHAAGDVVLQHVAQVLREQTRTGDCLARIGGDEFLLLFPGQTDHDRLATIAARIIEAVQRPVQFEGQAAQVSASIGIAISTLYRKPDPRRLVGDADEALYAAKRMGRGRATISRLPLADFGGA
jgi:diguanylate cyclase (GGDEF)-like protein